MPTRENKNWLRDPKEENDKSFIGNEEKQLAADANNQADANTSSEEEGGEQDSYRSRSLEIEKERD